MLAERPDGVGESTFEFGSYGLDWCTTICEEIEDDDQCAHLIYPALQVGFRRFSPEFIQFGVGCVPADHQRMVDLVFKCGDCEVVAYALCAWTSPGNYDHRAPLLGPCVEHLVELAHAGVEFPPRLGRVTTRAINLIDFELVGVERFVGLSARLEVGIDDVVNATDSWTSLILRVIASIVVA